MATLTDLLFVAGDFALTSSGDLSLTFDNEAIAQVANLNLALQIGFNQYTPSAGWDWMRYEKANLTQVDFDAICLEVKRMLEGLDFVISAECTYLGSDKIASQNEQIFDVSAQTIFGTLDVPFALGGLYAGS